MPKLAKMSKRVKKETPPKVEDRRPKITVTQLRILLEAIEKDPRLYNTRDSEIVAFLTIKKWNELAKKLNESLNGAPIPVSNWKCALRYWSKKVQTRTVSKKKPKQMKLSMKETNELCELEKRFKEFLDIEEAKEIVNITYNGRLGPNSGDAGTRFVLHMLDVFSTDDDDNAPWAQRRCFITRERDRSDPTGKTKRYRIVFDRVGDLTEEQRLAVEAQQEQFQAIAAAIAESIAFIQNRVQMVKDMWKHRCGYN